MPLRLYPPSEQPDTSFVKPFIYDYGLDKKGEIKIFESFVLYKFSPKLGQIGKKLSFSLTVPVNHNTNNILTIFIKHGSEPSLMLGGHDLQSQLNTDMITQGEINPLKRGDYFIKIMTYSQRDFNFVRGGGAFALNLTVENNLDEAIADIGFTNDDIMRV